MNISVSVIVLAWNGEKYLKHCLAALFAQDYTPLQVIVVDNGSNDASVQIAQGFGPRLELVQNGYNFGFAGGVNIGISHTTGDVVVLLNQDTEVQPGWLRSLVETFAEDSSTGVVGSKAIYPDSGRLQHAGGFLRAGDAFAYHIGRDEEDHGQYDTVTDMDYVTGTAFAIHRKVIEEIGTLDEGFFPAFYEETDYCYRARRAGFRVVYQPDAVLLHHETTSLPRDSYALVSTFHRSRVRFVLRHWAGEELAAFIEAEQQATDDTQWLDDAVARARAYWHNLVHLAEIAHQRHTNAFLGAPWNPGQTRQLADNLDALRQRSHSRVHALVQSMQTGPQSACLSQPDAAPQNEPAAGGIASADAVGASSQETFQALAEQIVHGQVLLGDATAHVPLLGKLVARLRSLWLLLPILRQQSRINAQVAETLRLLSAETLSDHSRRLYTVETHLRDLDRRTYSGEEHLRSLDRDICRQGVWVERVAQMLHDDDIAILDALGIGTEQSTVKEE